MALAQVLAETKTEKKNKEKGIKVSLWGIFHCAEVFLACLAEHEPSHYILRQCFRKIIAYIINIKTVINMKAFHIMMCYMWSKNWSHISLKNIYSDYCDMILVTKKWLNHYAYIHLTKWFSYQSDVTQRNTVSLSGFSVNWHEWNFIFLFSSFLWTSRIEEWSYTVLHGASGEFNFEKREKKSTTNGSCLTFFFFYSRCFSLPQQEKVSLITLKTAVFHLGELVSSCCYFPCWLTVMAHWGVWLS